MNLLITGTGRSGTKALQLYLTLALLQKHEAIHLNYEPYLWKTRKGRFSFEGIRHHVSSVCFPTDSDQLSRKHHRYFERMVASELPTITKCIRGLGRMSFLKDDLEAELWIHVVRDLYDVLDSLERQDWNLCETGPPIFPFPKIDLWPKYLEESNKLPVPKEIRAAIVQAKSEMEKNAVCWYLDNLAVLTAKSHPNMVLLQSHFSEKASELLALLNMKQEDMSFSFYDFKGSQLRNDDWLINADNQSNQESSIPHRWNQWAFSTNLPGAFYLPESVGNTVNMQTRTSASTLQSSARPRKATLPRTDFFDQLNEDIKSRF